MKSFNKLFIIRTFAKNSTQARMKKIFTILFLFSILCGTSASYALDTPSHVENTTYNADGHYWTVYLVASLLKIPNARELAYYAELPDHVFDEKGNHKRATMTWMNVFMQGKVHALTGKSPDKERERSRKMYETAKDIKRKGWALHRLGDSYAHAKSDEKKMYKRGFGHAFAPEHGHEPDMIRNYPEKYLRYVADLTYVLGGKEAKIDMTAFEYIAEKKLETADNIEILKAEVVIACRGTDCEIARGQSANLQAYLDYRSTKCGFSSKMEDIASKKKKNLRTKVILNFAPVEGATH